MFYQFIKCHHDIKHKQYIKIEWYTTKRVNIYLDEIGVVLVTNF